MEEFSQDKFKMIRTMEQLAAKKIILALLVVAFSTSAVLAQIKRTYLDINKFDRFAYRFKQGSDNDKSFLAYAFSKSEDEKILLETGLETDFFKQSVTLSNPQDVSFTTADIDDINKGKHIVYIARKVEGGYRIALVGAASSIGMSANTLQGHGSDYGFSVNLDNISGDDVATQGTTSAVFYVGQDIVFGNHSAHQIYRSPREVNRASSNLFFLPKVGMVREIVTSENAMTVMELVSINDIPIEKYLENPTQVAATTTVTGVEPPPSVPADPDIQVGENMPTLAAKGVKNDIVCDEVAGENEHLIQQGDNLFAISRRYGVTVDQLKRWNKLETDLIHPCQKLVVVMPQAEKDALKAKGNDPKMPPAVKIPKEYDVRDKPKPLVNSPKPVIKKLDKGQEKVVPKGFTGSVTSPEPVAKALYIKKDAGLYVVQKGDNIYSIAKRHNLTEDKLRCINGLKNDERILVGQVLKIEDCNCATMSEKIVEKPTPSDTLVNVPKGYSEVVKPSSVKKYHIVREGENLYSIARTYGLTAEKLVQLNHFGQHEAVLPNQKILIED